MSIRYRSGFPCVLLLAAVFFCVSCNSSDSSVSEDGRCTSDAQCRTGERCLWGACQTTCDTDSDCSDDLRCHPKGVCAECAAHADCESGQLCEKGVCRDSGNWTYGNACESSGDCLEGQVCADGVCALLCWSALDCPPALPVCGGEHLCVECVRDSDCDGDAICVAERCEANSACEEECDAATGFYCDEGTGDCVSVECLPCDEDADCESPYVCVSSETAGGGGICLTGGTCPAGTARGLDSYCHPVATCPGVSYAPAAQACSFPGDPDLPPCVWGHVCLYNSSVSFCSRTCSDFDTDCADAFPGGCCRSVSGSEPYCLTGSFCE